MLWRCENPLNVRESNQVVSDYTPSSFQGSETDPSNGWTGRPIRGAFIAMEVYSVHASKAKESARLSFVHLHSSNSIALSAGLRFGNDFGRNVADRTPTERR